MSAPISDQSLSSISSSGHADGLGRRLLAFDRETGAILERLFLRPELAAFEATIRERIDIVASLEDERFARPGSVERDPGTGALTVLSEFVAGSRLSDLLETAEEAGVVPGVDVALGFLLEALPALSSFHGVTGCSHGLIAPPRIVLTPGGQVVFLDAPFGAIVERLGLSRSRLWGELGVAAPQDSGAVRFDHVADISQVALSAVMLVIGRRLRDHEYPASLPPLLAEVVEVAQIRASSVFATSLQRLLQRSLPVPGRRPFESADDLANEIRLLLRREIGAEVCRQALVDFVEQMDGEPQASRSGVPAGVHAGNNGHAAIALDDLSLDALDSLDSIEVLDIEDAVESGSLQAREEDSEEIDEEEFAEVPLEPEPAPEREIPDPWSFDPGAAERQAWHPAESAPTSAEPAAETEPPAVEEASASAAVSDAPIATPVFDDSAVEVEASAELEAEEAVSPEPSASLSLSSRRKKRQQKSARARKDKLRSATAPKPQPQAKPAEPRTQGGWIVNPDRAAAFAPAIPEPPIAQPPVMVGHPAPVPVPQPVVAIPAAAPTIALTPPAPPPIVPAAASASIPMPVYGAPAVAQAAPPAAPIAIRPAPVAVAQPKPAAPVRLKPQAPSGYAPPRQTAPPPAVGYVQRGPMFETEEPRRFPWKMALFVLVAVALAVVVGRAYLPSKAAGEAEDAAEMAADAESQPAVVVMPKIETGHITVETQPGGARVLLDGKHVGQSPLKLADVPVGRHTLKIVSQSGEVTRTVRVEAGKTALVDASIFSGWVAVFAPVVLDVSINGRSIGTTERERLMLPAGSHQLMLISKEFGYRTVQTVQVEPGEVRSVNLDPRGAVNFNAVPWAEVWMDGKKLGDTPLANMQVPLGTREFVFRNPAFGERKVTTTVRADQPSAIGVDFTRPQ